MAPKYLTNLSSNLSATFLKSYVLLQHKNRGRLSMLGEIILAANSFLK